MQKNDRKLTDILPVTECMADRKMKKLEWLWPNRIPMKMLTLIAGSPGPARSALMADIAARVSTGHAWPDVSNSQKEPGSVIILTGEHDLATVRVRLQAAGADLRKVTILKASDILSKGRKRRSGRSDPPAWTGLLAKAIEALGDARLVIIDPITTIMGGRNPSSDKVVRESLYPLVSLARKHGVAMVGVRHINKPSKKSAIYCVTGSIEFVHIPRVVWLVTEDPRTKGRWLLLLLKTNLTEELPGLAFSLEGPADRPKCRFEQGAIYRKADEVLSERTRV